ncbi:MAG: hypothetical protein RQ847_01310 [Wenzhouxiangellaceae bacterium]|nr:hypothetical protein [Wenzhouxiangellaceae bacterium]
MIQSGNGRSRDGLLLAGWLAAVVVATCIHDPAWLAVLLLGALALHGREAWSALRRALIAVAVVNVAISFGYAVAASAAGTPWAEFVLRLNLRVVLLAVLTFWMARNVRLERALAFSPSLQFIVVLVRGQLGTFRAMLADARQAFESRNPARIPFRPRLKAAGRQAAALLDKAELQADALNQGMRSRGFFDDRP